jgi:hypothetical protein
MSVIRRCEIKQHGCFRELKCPTCKRKAHICNHRTVIKIVLNPILRLFGYEIGSIFENDKFVKYCFVSFNSST